MLTRAKAVDEQIKPFIDHRNLETHRNGALEEHAVLAACIKEP